MKPSKDVSAVKTKQNSPVNTRYYRFGLCGLTAGGKTCLLAALNLPRVPHPFGLTVTPVNLDDKATKDLVDGREWIDEACDALKLGLVPKPNPHTGRLTLQYKFTDGKKSEWFVELVDYSGELLDARLSREKLAASLREYFKQVDGFLFIAEYPHKGEQAGELGGYLQNLTRALALMQSQAGKKSDDSSAPIALLINKWDRSGTLSNTVAGYSAELHKLASFLDTSPKPPHADLMVQLEAAANGHCKVFPVSAFGQAERQQVEGADSSVEKPVRVTPQLPSFGLEEPFLWLTEKCESIHEAKITQESTSYRSLVNPISALRCSGRATRELRRLRQNSPHRDAFRKAITRMRLRLGVHLVAFVIMLAGIEFSIDAFEYRSARVALEDPTAPLGWETGEGWYHSYMQAPRYRHSIHKYFVLSNADAEAKLMQALRKREENAWKMVSSCGDKDVQVALAQEFLKSYPRSHFSHEAIALIEEYEVLKAREELQREITSFEHRLGEIAERVKAEGEKSPEIRDYKKIADNTMTLIQSIEAWKSGPATDDQRKLHRSVANRAAAIMNGLSRLLGAAENRKTFNAFVGRGDWEAAANFLVGLPAKDYPDLREKFQGKAIYGIEDKARSKVGNGAGWEVALAYLGGFQNEPIRSLLPSDGLARLAKMETYVKSQGDQWLYKKCVASAGLQPFLDYHESSPVGSMRPVIKEWIAFKKQKQKVGRYRIGVSQIKWSEEARKTDTLWDKENRLALKIGEVKKEDTLWSDRKGTMNLPGAEFKKVVDQIDASKPLWISIRIDDVDTPDDWDSLGSGEVTMLPEDLDGKKLQLKGSKHGINTATLSCEAEIEGEWRKFKAPPLPMWTPTP